MKKIVLLMVVLSCAAGLWAQSEDVFEAGNMEFGGEMHMTWMPTYYITDADDREANKGEYDFLLDATGNIGLFLIDKLSFQVMPGIIYSHSVSDNGDRVRNSMMLTLLGGVDYYFRTSSPWTFSVGLDTGIMIIPGIDGKDLGVDDPDDSLELMYLFNPNATAYYFTSDRLAPYVSIAADFWNYFRVKETSGDSYDYTDGRTFMQRWEMQFKISIGFKYFLPTGFRFLSGEEKKYTDVMKFGT